MEFDRVAASEGDTVSFVSFVRDYSDDSRTLTANELRAAGTDYPDWVRERYLQGARTPTSSADPGHGRSHPAERVDTL